MTGALGLGFSTLGEQRIPLARVVELAHAHRAPGVELRVADWELLHPASSIDDAAALGAELAAARVTVLGLSSYVALCSPDPAHDTSLVWHLELAAAVGARGVRVFMKADHDRAASEHRGAGRLRSVAEASARTGVRVLVETHDSHPTATSVARFLDAAGVSPELAGAIWDTAHSWTAGEPPAESLDAIAPWLAHLQIKDVLAPGDSHPVELGSGVYPIAQLASVVAAHGWRGWAALEWERTWHPELSPLADALCATRTWARALLTDDGTPEQGDRS